MKIITLMYYHHEPYITMCKSWIFFAKKFNPNAHITIYAYSFHADIIHYTKKFSRITLVKMQPQKDFKNLKGITHISQYLQLSLWNYIHEPCIYVDADALILDSLDSWWSVIHSKPFIAVSEARYKGKQYFNAGVFSYSGNDFITLKKMKHILKNAPISIPIGQQGLLNMYMERLGYDWSHPKIDYSYNCFAKKCQITSITDDFINIKSGKYTSIERFCNHLFNSQTDLWEDWLWWNKPKQVKILHAFRHDSKFWDLRECKKLWEHCLEVTQ